jgi:NADPH-dependent curcumin reductase CurA
MAATATKRWILREKPFGVPVVSGEKSTFELTTATLPALQDNQVLLKTVFLSNDPAQRSWISPLSDPRRSYLPPLEPGEPMRSLGLGRVVESRSADMRPDTLVLARTGWSEFSVHDAQTLTPIKPPAGLRETHFLGALGLPGFTAYYALTQIVGLGKPDILVVSAAAGAVGSMVVQIAKKVLGCGKVSGISTARCGSIHSMTFLFTIRAGHRLRRHRREMQMGRIVGSGSVSEL